MCASQKTYNLTRCGATPRFHKLPGVPYRINYSVHTPYYRSPTTCPPATLWRDHFHRKRKHTSPHAGHSLSTNLLYTSLYSVPAGQSAPPTQRTTNRSISSPSSNRRPPVFRYYGSSRPHHHYRYPHRHRRRRQPPPRNETKRPSRP